mmetsp:Transcript_41121/g.68841  ORF Transcript_41121/g.68841 Transcript_41121/m.68841 type:complete len:241 (-) Transcript_41121:771-1493(-)
MLDLDLIRRLGGAADALQNEVLLVKMVRGLGRLHERVEGQIDEAEHAAVDAVHDRAALHTLAHHLPHQLPRRLRVYLLELDHLPEPGLPAVALQPPVDALLVLLHGPLHPRRVPRQLVLQLQHHPRRVLDLMLQPRLQLEHIRPPGRPQVRVVCHMPLHDALVAVSRIRVFDPGGFGVEGFVVRPGEGGVHHAVPRFDLLQVCDHRVSLEAVLLVIHDRRGGVPLQLLLREIGPELCLLL